MKIQAQTQRLCLESWSPSLTPTFANFHPLCQAELVLGEGGRTDGERLFLQGRVHTHIAFKCHLWTLKGMQILLLCFITHTNLEDGWRLVLLPLPRTHLSDLISYYFSLCSSLHSWPHCCYSLNMPNTPLPQGLCSGHSSSTERTFPRIPVVPTPLPPSGLCSNASFSEKSPQIPSYSTLQAVVLSHSTLYFISLHPLTYILLIYLQYYLLPPIRT